MAPGPAYEFGPAAGPAASPSSPATSPFVYPALGAGAVISTIDLVSNRTLPGDAGVAVQIYPEYGVFDSNNGQIYLRNSIDSETPLGALNTTTGRMEADIATPGGAQGDWITPTVAVDTQTGYVYATNSLAPGNVSVINGATDEIVGSIPVGYNPDGIVFDPVNHDFYVANSGSHNVTVFSGATNLPVTSIQVGQGPTAAMFNPIDQQVLVTDFGNGTVTVINASTNTVYKNVTIGPEERAFPLGFAFDSTDDYVDVLNESFGGDIGNVTVLNAATGYSVVSHLKLWYGSDSLAWDPATDELFVANGLSENVSVFSQPGDTFVKSIPVGYESDEQCIVYDPVDGDIYVANPASGNVSVISPTLGEIVATIGVNHLSPLAITVDPETGNVYSINEGQAQIAPTVTVIAPTTHVAIDTIKLATYPEGFTYESPGNTLAVADDGGNATYFLNASTYRVQSITPAGVMPQGVAYDPYSQLTYTLNPESLNVTVVNAAGQRVATLSAEYDPESILYDPGTGDVYVTHLDENITVINGTSHDSIASFAWHGDTNPYDMVYDSHNHDVYVSNEVGTNLSIIAPGSATGVFDAGAVQVGYNPSSLAFDPENNTIWVSNLGGAPNNLTVIDDSTQKQVESVTLNTFPNLVVYDPKNNAVYSAPGDPDEVVAYNASTYQLLPGGPIVYSSVEGNLGSIGYDPATGDLLVSQMNTGAIYVIGPNSATSYPVSFVESGLPSGTSWTVTLNGAPGDSTDNSIGFTELNGTDYPYTVGTIAGYVANVTSGDVTVAGTEVTVDIGFTSVNSVYPVNFQESGLPASTSWSITLDGVEDASSTNTIGFSEPNGSDYAFTVGSVTGYLPNVPSGEVTVSGQAQTVPITFTAIGAAYSVTFSETGLASGTTWGVVLNGSLLTSTTATIQFSEPNGSYPFTVGTLSGYTAAPSSGTVPVQGAPASEAVTFTAVVTPLAATLTATPATISLGGSITLTTDPSGGTTPYSYLYTGLPAGCSTSDAATLACTPTASGTFTVTVNVTDGGGTHVLAVATLTVQSTTPTTPAANGLTSTEWIIIIVVVVVVVLLLLIAFWWRRRKKTPPPSGTPPAGSAVPPAGGSPPPST